MSCFSGVYSELIKVKHTAFKAIHCFLPLVGALLFVLYFVIYENADSNKKLRMILELTATVFPLMISVVVSLNVALEEKASCFQTLLAVCNRKKIFLLKLVALYGIGMLAFCSLVFFFTVGAFLCGIAETVPLKKLIWSACGIAIFNFIIYLWHLFLSLQFGFGISLFFGVFESLQCILYSNIELPVISRYIPFAWTMNWIQDIMTDSLKKHTIEWILMTVFTMLCLFLMLVWFSHWEGRKNHE